MSYFWLGRKYQLCKSLYFDDYMQALKVGAVLRKMGNSLCPIVSINYDDETEMYTMITETEYLTSTINFKLDEEFDEVTTDGRKCKSTISLSGNTLVHIQKHPKVTATIMREFCDTGMLAAFMACGKKSIRMYKNYVEPKKGGPKKKKEPTSSSQAEYPEGFEYTDNEDEDEEDELEGELAGESQNENNENTPEAELSENAGNAPDSEPTAVEQPAPEEQVVE